MTKNTIDRYLVVGNPIAHSLSPKIHALFAKQTNQSLQYETQLIELNSFETTMQELCDIGLQGANVTVPFKEEAFRWAEQCTQRATLAKAVNTLYWQDNKIIGDNTDGIGLVKDIKQNCKGELKNKKILILGAGGAVRGVLPIILGEHPLEIVVVNRTISKAQQLQSDFKHIGNITTSTYEDLEQSKKSFDWIINGTSIGLAGAIPPISSHLISSDTCCYDMVYAKQQTAFNQWCSEHGSLRCYDGLGMLVEQAAEAFRIWRGVQPKTAEVFESLRGS